MWTAPLPATDPGLAAGRQAAAVPQCPPRAPTAEWPALNRRVMVVESDARWARTIGAQLRRLGCTSLTIGDGAAALAAMRANESDLAIVAARLPGLDGLELHRRLRAQGLRAPTVMLAGDAAELRAVLALDPMADDVLVKPFGALELAARLASVLRRGSSAAPDRAPAGPAPTEAAGLLVDRVRREVRLRGRVLELTAREFDLLAYLAANPGRVFTRAELLDRIWGHAPGVYEHTVSSHVNRLRAKIEDDPTRPRYVCTTWGVGYRFGDRGS
jgi:DNA-binding response OmpR family regulator